MAKDLTTSEISRQNILNNPVALPRIREAFGDKTSGIQRCIVCNQADGCRFL